MSTPAKVVSTKKRPVPVKTSLNSPYSIRWEPLLNKEHRNVILETLRTRICDLALRKHHVPVFRERGTRKRPKRRAHKPTSEQMSASVPTESAEVPTKPSEPGWNNPGVRKQLAIGINEVTRALERNDLSLVLVCNSVAPEHMTTHLIPLSKTRSVPACQVPGLSERLSEMLGLKCVLALGIRRGGEAFEDAVRIITPLVPELFVSWIPTETKQRVLEMDAEAGKKRKLEELSSESSPVTLQPLKVKKIIPNPNKIRKPKLKRRMKC